MSELVDELRYASKRCVNAEFSSKMRDAADAIEEQEAKIEELEDIIRGKDDVLYEKRDLINHLRESIIAPKSK